MNLKHKIPVCIFGAADTVSQNYICLLRNHPYKKNFLLARKLFGFNLNDFREMTIIAMKSAFMHHDERKIMIKNIAEELELEFGLKPEYIER